MEDYSSTECPESCCGCVHENECTIANTDFGIEQGMTQTIEQLRARVAELEEQYQLATDVTNATLERNRELETSAATAVQQYKDEGMKLAGEPVAEVIRKFSYKGDFEMAVVRWAREIPAHGKDLFTSDQLVAATARLEAELTQCKDEKAMCIS